MTMDRFPILGRIFDKSRRLGNKAKGLLNKETNELLDPFKPQNRKDLFNKNKDSISLPTSVSEIDGFNKWETSKVKGLADFGAIKLPDDKTIQSKLGKNQANLSKVNEAITEATKIEPKTTVAKDKFNDMLAAMNKMMEAKNEPFTFADYAEQLQAINTDAKTALTEQHKIEKDNLTALFTDDDFSTNLKAGLGLLDKTQFDSVKTSMLAEMDNKHKAEISTFEEKITKEVKTLQDAEQKESDRISYLAIVYEHNEAMRKEIDRLHLQNRTSGDVDAHIEVGFGSEKYALFKNINVKDLKIIEDISGEELKKAESADGNIIYTSKLPKQFFAPLYSSQLAELRLAGIAQAVRASGKDTITLSIKYRSRETPDNQEDEHAMELGRIAYAKALESGFKYKVTYADDDKEKKNPICDITIEVNGKKKTVDELFGNCQERLRELHGKADKDEEQRKSFRENQKSTPQTQTNMKQRLQGLVAEDKQAKKQVTENELPRLTHTRK